MIKPASSHRSSMLIVQYAFFTLLLSLAFSAFVFADEDREMETILVIGKRPGPALWKVSHGENVLYIFGYLPLVPKGIDWDSARVKGILEKAQEFIGGPNEGVFFPIPQEQRNNPDGKKLKDVLPSDTNDRFEVFLKENFRHDRAIERLRPIFASSSLANSIFRQHGLIRANKILKKIDKLANRNRKLKRAQLAFERPEDLIVNLQQEVIKMVAELTPEREVSCFEAAINRMMEDIDLLKQRANAWAEGDVSKLTFLEDDLRKHKSSCPFHFLGSRANLSNLADHINPEVFAEYETAKNQYMEHWLSIVDNALASNETSFAVLNISQLLGDGGVLDKLRERGYAVKEPL